MKLPETKVLLFIPLFSLLFFSCARPDYVNDLNGKIDGVIGECGLLFKSENICLSTKWNQRPSESEFGEMILTFKDAKDPERLVDPIANPTIILWMPSMGHGSSPVSIERVGLGTYRAFDIFFIMPGEWDIRYQLKNSNDVIEEKIQKITL